jgi:enoyl-CoA hydratase/carnithine racemase
VVAGEQAQFGFPEVGVGLSVTGGVSLYLTQLVGLAKARELLLLGDRIDAMAAQRIGLIARVAPEGEHEAVAGELARRLADRPPVALDLAKRALDHGLGATLEPALALEIEHALVTSHSGEDAAPLAEFRRG